MAAGPWTVYSEAIFQIANGTIDLDTDAFRCVLVTASYTPVKDVVGLTWAAISTNEVAAGGAYATHGVALTTTVTRPGSPSDTIMFDSSVNPTWNSSTITAKYACIIRDADSNGSLAAGDIPLAFCDLNAGGGSVSTTNGTFAITIATEGIFNITSNP